MSTQPKTPTGDKIEAFPLRDYRGEVFAEGTIYKGRSRASGRRIIVRGPGGAILYDGGESYDRANAFNGLDWWVLRHLGPSPKLAERFQAGYVPPTDCMEHNAYLTWTEAQARQADTDEIPVAQLYDEGANTPGEGGGGGA